MTQMDSGKKEFSDDHPRQESKHEHGLVSSVETEAVYLPRHIGVFKASGIIVSAVVGIGIFLSPRGVVAGVRSVGATMLIWVLCGVLAMVSSFANLELATMIPKAGGSYAFIYEAFGAAMAFSVVWLDMIITTPANLILMGRTAAVYMLGLAFNECGPPGFLQTLFSLALTIFAMIVNGMSVRAAPRSQLYFSIMKIFALLAIIAMGIANLARGATDVLSPSTSFKGTDSSPGAISAAIYSGYFAYTGVFGRWVP